MALRYHSFVHQLLGAMQCPAHGDWLEETCRECGQASAYRLDAQLLGAGARASAAGEEMEPGITWVEWGAHAEVLTPPLDGLFAKDLDQYNLKED